MKDIIVCDLDGTLADLRHRRHFVEKKRCMACADLSWGSTDFCRVCAGTGYEKFKPNWPAFHAACVDDTPLQTTIDLVRMLADGMQNASYISPSIWVVSGRSDEVKDETVQWLSDYVGEYDRLIMRRAGDYTPDDVLKRSWLADGTIPKERVFCVFDDRDRVVQMYRNEGLTCYQVANGDF